MYVRPLRVFWSLSFLAVLAMASRSHGRDIETEPPGASPATDGQPSTPDQGKRLILEDALEPLLPKQPRTEADQDRLEALSLFAAGHMLQRQQQYAEALRLYQRALRCDPEAVTVGRAIVPLAFRLKRYGEAVRYALKIAQLEDPDPVLLERLGAYLLEMGRLDEALTLYEKALTAREGTPANTAPSNTAAEIRARMEIGRLYLLSEEYDKAADNFARVRDALDRPEEFGLDDRTRKRLLDKPQITYHLFGEAFLQVDRLDEAAAAFEKAHQLAPDEGLRQFNQARLHTRRKEPADALAALEACFAQHLASEGTAPYELLGEVLAALGKPQELIGRLETLRAGDPANVPLGYALAGKYFEAEQFEKAEPLYLALIKETPTRSAYRNLLEIYRKADRVDALLSVLAEIVEKSGSLEGLGEQAQSLAKDAELMPALVESGRKMQEAEPDKFNYHMRFALALLAVDAKQFETAAEFFNLAANAKPDEAFEVLLVWGVALMFEERPAEAAKVFQRAIDEKVLGDDDPRFYYFLAGALAMDGRTDEALAASASAVAAQDDSPRFHSRVAWVLYRGKRTDEAIGAYRALIEKFGDDYESADTRGVIREAKLVLSTLYVLKEDFAEAEEWLQQVLDEFPDDVSALNDLGYLWADQGKHLQRALEMTRKAVEAEPDNIAYRDSLGWVFYRLGRYKEAVVELEKAAAGTAEDDATGDAIILDHLGDAYLSANQPDKAKETWQRAVKAFQEEEEPEKAKAVEEKIGD